jgi:hypothetical protein
MLAQMHVLSTLATALLTLSSAQDSGDAAPLAAAYPVGAERLPASARGPREVSADFDSDGMIDRAALLHSPDYGKVELWVFLGTDRGFPLSSEPATAAALGSVLEVRVGGDHSCADYGRHPAARRAASTTCPPSW